MPHHFSYASEEESSPDVSQSKVMQDCYREASNKKLTKLNPTDSNDYSIESIIKIKTGSMTPKKVDSVCDVVGEQHNTNPRGSEISDYLENQMVDPTDEKMTS